MSELMNSGASGPLTLDEKAAMHIALDEARAAAEHGDVPVGAVVVSEGTVVASRHNERELRHDPTAHAEILALRDAAWALGSWRLNMATLVVTLEPCPMCAGAAVVARLGRIVFGAVDPKAGACGSLYQLCSDPRLNYELPVTGGVLADEASDLLTDFFSNRR
ncbi:MAG: tRNA adenosine(34) deaminase TadA [Acidimicrobiales bacterium]|jgi:tRNA(adenine34) deaminase